MQENQSIAISCRGVHEQFGNGTRIQALRGVDFEARLGELTFIVGPSGCGKTTLLSVITGLLDPSDGEVELFGSSAGRLPANQRILFRRENVGFVFQQFNLLPALTAAENAAVPLIAAGMKRTEAVERAKALLDQLGLNGRRDALPATLSGGEQQRVAIARALVHEPRLVNQRDRKSTRLNSSHPSISYAVFCLKKKTMRACDRSRTTIDVRDNLTANAIYALLFAL